MPDFPIMLLRVIIHYILVLNRAFYEDDINNLTLNVKEDFFL